MEDPVSLQQSWSDFPAKITAQREHWLSVLENLRREFIPAEDASLSTEDFGITTLLDSLSWSLPLAEALKICAADSDALSLHSPDTFFDKSTLCLSPNWQSSSQYLVMCRAVAPNTFTVTAAWRDHLSLSTADGRPEVIRAGTNHLFKGNAEDTADYLVHLVESWEASESPLP
jgi:hypothetical protein